MKGMFLMILTVIYTSLTSFSQNEGVKPNSVSFNILGTSTYAGFSYERIFADKLRAEIGVGVLGVGAGLCYHPFSKISKGILSPYIGIKNVYQLYISEYNITYMPIGITYFFKNNWSAGIDVGPAYKMTYSPWGKVTEQAYNLYPKSNVSIFGGAKLSYHF